MAVAVAIAKEQLQEAFNKSFSKDTAGIPSKWVETNPAYSHCTLTTLVSQDLRGGEIVTATLFGDWVDVLNYTGHSWTLKDQMAEDYTASQFPENFPYDDLISGRGIWGRYRHKYQSVNEARVWLLSNPGVPTRYRRFKRRVEHHLGIKPDMQTISGEVADVVKAVVRRTVKIRR